MVNKVLQVPQQQGQQGFSFGDKYGGNHPLEIVVSTEVKAMFDMYCVFADAVERLLRFAGMVYGQRLQPSKMPKWVGKCGVEHGAKARETIEQMAEQVAQVGGSCLQLRLPGESIRRHQPDQVFCALNLFAQLQANILNHDSFRQWCGS